MSAKTLSIIAIVLWVGTAGFAAKMFITGDTVATDDGREAIILDAGERDFILAEMRGMLMGVQEILSAANAGDMVEVAAVAKLRGMQEAQTVPVATMLKLPMPFKQLGNGTHKLFDNLGQNSEMGKEQVLEDLEGLMGNCISCHEMYKLVSAE